MWYTALREGQAFPREHPGWITEEDGTMRLYKTKLWTPMNIACLKWSCIFFGMIVGAYLPDITKQYVWVFAALVVLLAIKPTIAYLKDDQ
jgi:hypothetical protein